MPTAEETRDWTTFFSRDHKRLALRNRMLECRQTFSATTRTAPTTILPLRNRRPSRPAEATRKMREQELQRRSNCISPKACEHKDGPAESAQNLKEYSALPISSCCSSYREA